jgi:hypothetical protein
MLHPSRTVVASLMLVALVGLVLGLATDVGLFGWSRLLCLSFTSSSLASRYLLSVRDPRTTLPDVRIDA